MARHVNWNLCLSQWHVKLPHTYAPSCVLWRQYNISDTGDSVVCVGLQLVLSTRARRFPTLRHTRLELVRQPCSAWEPCNLQSSFLGYRLFSGAGRLCRNILVVTNYGMRKFKVTCHGIFKTQPALTEGLLLGQSNINNVARTGSGRGVGLQD